MTAQVVLIDVETYRTRDPRVLELLRREAIEKEPNQNTKIELKATWHSEAAREKRIREAVAKTSVDVLRAEVLCIGVVVDDEPPRVYSGMGQDPKVNYEAHMLTRFSEDLRAVTSAETIWAGHNVEAFDFPIILNRARRWGVMPPEHFPQPHNGKMRGRIYDTMLRIPSGHGLSMVSLRDASLAYGLPEPKTRLALPDGRPMSGALVGEAFEAGEHDLICQYCLEDMDASRALYRACTFDGQWGTWEVDAELEQAIAAVWGTPKLGPDRQAAIVLELLAHAGKIPRRFAGVQAA